MSSINVRFVSKKNKVAYGVLQPDGTIVIEGEIFDSIDKTNDTTILEVVIFEAMITEVHIQDSGADIYAPSETITKSKNFQAFYLRKNKTELFYRTDDGKGYYLDSWRSVTRVEAVPVVESVNGSLRQAEVFGYYAASKSSDKETGLLFFRENTLECHGNCVGFVIILYDDTIHDWQNMKNRSRGRLKEIVFCEVPQGGSLAINVKHPSSGEIEPFAVSRYGDRLEFHGPNDGWLVTDLEEDPSNETKRRIFPARIAVGPNVVNIVPKVDSEEANNPAPLSIIWEDDKPLSKTIVRNPENLVVFSIKVEERDWLHGFRFEHSDVRIGVRERGPDLHCLVRELIPGESVVIDLKGKSYDLKRLFFTRDRNGEIPSSKTKTMASATRITFDEEGRDSSTQIMLGLQNGYFVFDGDVIGSWSEGSDFTNAPLIFIDSRGRGGRSKEVGQYDRSCVKWVGQFSTSQRLFNGKEFCKGNGSSVYTLDEDGILCIRYEGSSEKSGKNHLRYTSYYVTPKNTVKRGLPGRLSTFVRALSSLDRLGDRPQITDKCPLLIRDGNIIIGGFVAEFSKKHDIPSLMKQGMSLVCLLPEYLGFEFDNMSTQGISDKGVDIATVPLLRRKDIVLFAISQNNGFRTTIGNKPDQNAAIEVMRRENWVSAYRPRTERRISSEDATTKLPAGQYFMCVDENGSITFTKIDRSN